ncbi:dol-P-Glc:Glc(2)Man(9)GlcNAc(2)-PP-Dol alpha-1,2-glucosyltransferase-like [Hydractinia symbiolongicarpus]|uniref:dol-P-Glc:Glc(2)Man(9)GlcNAc(2)-PP-Dol alpha-1,2-glucosyltransferase-like n=1 Tax=Hydractinia symbiolongicarpus TaxID=13093 RepID=UPI002549D249|nr:dol-P-Glc:Glc(2)Man(9)GlcNAc(2)-PP-Dol alpha-1,2-glucosyltransferase-like [Hydractinia symbiolongicarpus]
MALETGHVLLLFLLVVMSYFFQEVNKQQPAPYMDEIFHIPQAQNYCSGHFNHWNKKITTLPGLYLSSQLFLKISTIFSDKGIESICDAKNLRLTNVIFIMGCATILRGILRILCRTENNGKEEKDNKKAAENDPDHQAKILITSVVLTTFPLLFFFTFLYYTDVGSTFFVLFSYYFTLTNAHMLSAFTGVLAVFFRQTNIVWVGFNMATGILIYLRRKRLIQEKSNLFQSIFDAVKGILAHYVDVLLIAIPYCIVFLSFLLFVIKNKGIVVGDRTSHEASLNVPQLFYFSTFVMIYSSFLLYRYANIKNIWTDIKNIVTSPRKLLLCLLAIGVMLYLVHNFTYVHKYLISDNRHYTFYIWKRIFEKHWAVKYALVPGYLLSWLIIFNELNKSNRSIWILLYLLCTAAVLVPQKLLEFRYFIIPYLLFRLHIGVRNYLELITEFVLYMCVNAVTLYLFIYRPFKWDHEDAIQRFMW